MALALLLVLLAFAGAITIQFFTRGAAIRRIRPLEEHGKELIAASDLFCENFERLTNAAFSSENHVEVLANGDGVFPLLFDDLRHARHVITWQVFWFKPGALAEEVREILEERARAGVKVYCLFDYFGSHGLPEEYRESLRRAGVEVAVFRPLRLSSLYKVQQRSHVRSVVIDGRIGYTGGFGIDDSWRGGGRRPDEWRDTSVRLHGPVIDQLQAAFMISWAESTGDLILGRPLFSLADEAGQGDQTAGIFYTDPGLGSTRAERLFVLSIEAAQRELFITSAYFVPTRDLRMLLAEASGRGVDVRVLTPGANTDHQVTWYAARNHYRELMEAGIRIYEYDPTMIHAKTLVADGTWSALGTVNFDNRSIVLNDEVVLVSPDAAVAGTLRRLFLEDLEYATEVTIERFEKRGLKERMLEKGARIFSPFL